MSKDELSQQEIVLVFSALAVFMVRTNLVRSLTKEQAAASLETRDKMENVLDKTFLQQNDKQVATIIHNLMMDLYKRLP